MKSPGTTIKWVDDSGKTKLVEPTEIRPLFLAASSFDKGPEDTRIVYGDDFYKLYGTEQSFARHGQAAIQIANGIDNGAEYLIRRIVAKDATLANTVITAAVSQGQAAKVDPITGEAIYLDADTQQETTNEFAANGVDHNERVYVNTAIIKYDAVTFENCKTLTEVVEASKSLLEEQPAEDTSSFITFDGVLIAGDPVDNTLYAVGDVLMDRVNKLYRVKDDFLVEYMRTVQGESFVYPIIVVGDNGRGISSKRFKITTDYSLSKNVKFALYKLEYCGTADYDAEYIRFSVDPDKVYLGKSMALSEAGKDLVQLKPQATADIFHKFLGKISEVSGISKSEVYALDVLFGRTLKGEQIQQISIDETGYVLNSDIGLMLESGTNGEFGDAPVGSEPHTQALVEFFNGTTDDVVFDVDRYKIEVCLDANYPAEVKSAIAKLAIFREDFFFYRDFGLNNDTIAAMNVAAYGMEKSKFIGDYVTTYDIIDPFTKKQIPVTMLYSVTRLLISHLNNRRNTPQFGLLYDWTIPEAIEGTVNFAPKRTPVMNQRDEIVDAHFNYAAYQNGVLVVETQITSQVEETECSQISNIITVQEVIRDIRTLCPRIRGSFIDASDGLDRYAQDINAVIDKHRDKFYGIEFTWSADDVMLANKVFNAVIKVAFKNFVIAEEFTIYTVDQNQFDEANGNGGTTTNRYASLYA